MGAAVVVANLVFVFPAQAGDAKKATVETVDNIKYVVVRRTDAPQVDLMSRYLVKDVALALHDDDGDNFAERVSACHIVYDETGRPAYDGKCDRWSYEPGGGHGKWTRSSESNWEYFSFAFWTDRWKSPGHIAGTLEKVLRQIDRQDKLVAQAQ